MLSGFALGLLMAASGITTATDLQTIRAALEIAGVPPCWSRCWAEAERQVFLSKYAVGSIQLYTPFREMVERAIQEMGLLHAWGEYAATEEARGKPPALRVVASVPFSLSGGAYHLSLSYRPEGRTSEIVVVEPPLTVTPIFSGCEGCGPEYVSTVSALLLEASLPLPSATDKTIDLSDCPRCVIIGPSSLPRAADKKIDLKGPLTVTVTDPEGRKVAARFDLGELR